MPGVFSFFRRIFFFVRKAAGMASFRAIVGRLLRRALFLRDLVVLVGIVGCP